MSYSIICLEGEIMNQVYDNMVIELRRGTQILFVLEALKERQYGYSLLQELEKYNILIEAGTLYPLLRRLEQQGLLDSIWDTSETRPRKYYLLNDKGKVLLSRLKEDWKKIVEEMNFLYKEDKNE